MQDVAGDGAEGRGGARVQALALAAVVATWWRPQATFPEWAPLPDLLLALAACVAVATLPHRTLARPGAALLALVLAASHLAAVDAGASLPDLARWTRLTLAFALGSCLARSPAGPSRLARAAVAAGVAFSLHAALQAFVVHPALARDPDVPHRALAQLTDARGNSVFLLPAHLGAFLAAALPCAIALALAARGRRRAAAIGAGVALVGGLLVAGSFGGALLAALACGTFAVLVGSRRVVAGLALVALAVAAVGVAAAAWRRSGEIAGENPGSARVANWRVAARLVRERPVLGWGGGSFAAGHARLRAATGNDARHAHQQWLEEAAEHGLLVVPLGAALLGATALAGWRATRRDGSGGPAARAAVVAAAAACAGHSFIDFGWAEPAWGITAAVLVGAAWGMGIDAPASRAGRRVTIVAAAVLGTILLAWSVASSRASVHVAHADALVERAAGGGSGGELDAARHALAAAARWQPGSSSIAVRQASLELLAHARAPAGPTLDAAARAATRAVSASPWSAEPRLVLARVRRAQGRRWEALVQATRAAQLAPHDPRTALARELRDEVLAP